LLALRSRKLTVAGVVINRYPPGTPGLAEETNPRAIEKYGKTRVLCICPEDRVSMKPDEVEPPPSGITAAIAQVDWWGISAPAEQ
jgi:hypothetical protein